MSSYEEIKEKQIKYTEKMLKYLCLTVLGFCVGFGTGLFLHMTQTMMHIVLLEHDIYKQSIHHNTL